MPAGEVRMKPLIGQRDLFGNLSSETDPARLISHILPVVSAPSSDSYSRVVACPACGSEARETAFDGRKSTHECGACGLYFQVADSRTRPRLEGSA